MMNKIWEKLTQKVWDEGEQFGLEIGYMAGIQSTLNYLDALIASGDHCEHESFLEAIIEDLQNHNDS